MALSGLRHTLRRLGQSWGFSASVVVTLALGIGATVSVFSIIHAVLITPLTYRDPGQLYSIFQSKAANDASEMQGFAPANFLDSRAQNQTFTDLAASFGPHFNLTGSGEPRHLAGSAITPSLFSILGFQPMLGRAFLPDEDTFSSPHVVILSYRLWSSSFHRDAEIVGKSISLNGDPYAVVGIMPRNFQMPDADETDVWIPLQQQIRPDRMLWRDSHFLTVIGRLRPGITVDQARADMNRLAAQLKTQFPSSDNGSGAVVMPLQQALVGDTRTSLLLALGIVVLVLLIASSNVAILMLARVSGRARDFAVRRALGAGAPEILREVLSESIVLGLLAGLLGCLFAILGRRLFLEFAPYSGVDAIHLSLPVLAFTASLSLIVGFGFGLLPAIKVLHTDMQHVLHSSGNAATLDPGGRVLRHTLLVGEIALSIILLIPTGRLLRSMKNLQSQPLGFRTDHLMTTWIGLPRIRYQNNDDVATFFARVNQNLRDSVGAESVALGYRLPVQGDHFTTSFTLSGKSYQPGEYDQAALYFVDSAYLPLLKIPILDGRNFYDSDGAHSQRVAIVSAAFARKYWPDGSALGKFITILRDTPVPAVIVGVDADVRAPVEPKPCLRSTFPISRFLFRRCRLFY